MSILSNLGIKPETCENAVKFNILSMVKKSADLLDFARKLENARRISVDDNGNIEIFNVPGNNYAYRYIFINNGDFIDLEFYAFHAYSYTKNCTIWNSEGYHSTPETTDVTMVTYYELLPGAVFCPNIVVIYSSGQTVFCHMRMMPAKDLYGPEIDVSYIPGIGSTVSFMSIVAAELRLLKTPILAADKFEKLTKSDGGQIRTMKEILDIIGTTGTKSPPLSGSIPEVRPRFSPKIDSSCLPSVRDTGANTLNTKTCGKKQRTVIFTATPDALTLNLTFDVRRQNFFVVGNVNNISVPFHSVVVEWKTVERYKCKFNPAGFRAAADPVNANSRPDCVLMRVIGGDLHLRIYTINMAILSDVIRYKTADELGGDAKYLDSNIKKH